MMKVKDLITPLSKENKELILDVLEDLTTEYKNGSCGCNMCQAMGRAVDSSKYSFLTKYFDISKESLFDMAENLTPLGEMLVSNIGLITDYLYFHDDEITDDLFNILPLGIILNHKDENEE